MLSLSIAAACIIGCNYAANNCPSGTSQVGTYRSGRDPCEVYQGITDIATCKTSCESACDGGCAAFGYSAIQKRCATYQSAMGDRRRSAATPQDQIFCVVQLVHPECPSGFTQIGITQGDGDPQDGGPQNGGPQDGGSEGDGPPRRPPGDDIPVPQVRRLQTRGEGDHKDADSHQVSKVRPEDKWQCGQVFADSIGECVDYCNAHACCQAFSYSFMCVIYASPRALSGKRIAPNQILCAVTADLSAQSPGLFSVDGMVGYSNGNGQVYVQIPAYVVYGIVALILVNIVCLMVHFWNKSKGNSKEYKTVPMRSDIDEETDIN